ncbi:MAG: aminoacyl--tRNA ligase-related protein [Patescibacteria group bacterium]
MKMSHLFVQPQKDAGSGAETANHQLLVQAGFIDQLMAGVYTYLPLGLRVLENIRKIVREEVDGIGGQEIHMPALHPSENWKATGAWENVDVLFKLESRTGKEYALGQSHEEIVVPLMKKFIKSYRDLPRAVYQIQWKFRDELRAKSGIMRGREFEMKDMYSFHETQEDFDRFYAEAKQAYLRIFSRLGLIAKVTEASGGSFSKKISYEFMVLTDAGEDIIRYCEQCDFCINLEIVETNAGICPKCGSALREGKASEVGNIFDLGQRYTEIFDAAYATKEGERAYPIVGCYGIGITRAMGVIVEKLHDEKGILWPETIAPFHVSLVTFDGVEDEAGKIYEELQRADIEVLWDDREVSAGNKLADADLIGNPFRVIISKKSLEKGGYEVKRREEKEGGIIVGIEDLIKYLQR